MQYRNTQYQVVQTDPTSWKWKVQLDDNGTLVGSGVSRTQAIGLAQRAIDRASRPELLPLE